MNFKELLYSTIFVVLALTSCNIEHTISLDENLGGNNAVSIDANEMISTLRSLLPDTIKNTNEELLGNRNISENINNVQGEIDSLDGLSNFKFQNNFEKGVVAFSFDFEDEKYFEKGLEILAIDKTVDTTKESSFFVLGEDSLYLDFTSEAFISALGDNEGIEDLVDYNLGNYNFTLNLPFAIETVSNKLYLLSENKKTLTLKVPVKQLVTETETLNVLLTW